ncbi:MAG: LytR C-terminal domain-containing protein [Bifidobacteriaceae bacterium]|nr:LytR C-terminal domain-containing protein [Bifidobacteriaceae bacterium]
MSKNAYPYPPDEFDQVDLNARPKEVHAARRGAWSRVWPFLLVIVLVPGITFLAVHFLADKLPGGSPASSPSPVTSSADQPDAPVSQTPVTSEPSEPEPVTPTEPAPSAEPTAAAADKSISVTVYNAGVTKGAAAAAADSLTAAGFTKAGWAYEPNPADPAASTVYYSTDAQLATANQVAATLSIAQIELNPQVAGGNIVVVVR